MNFYQKVRDRKIRCFPSFPALNEALKTSLSDIHTGLCGRELFRSCPVTNLKVNTGPCVWSGVPVSPDFLPHSFFCPIMCNVIVCFTL